MVRRGRKSYRTQAQRDHRNRRRGGNTRSEIRARREREKRRALRDADKVRIEASPKPVELAGERHADAPVFGIYRDDEAGVWHLTALSFSRYKLSIPAGKVDYSAHYVGVPPAAEDHLWPDYGVPLTTESTKKAALDESGAETSERLRPGQYLVRPSHGAGRKRAEVDQHAVRSFISHFGARVYE
jgi:hypothetical protein